MGEIVMGSLVPPLCSKSLLLMSTTTTGLQFSGRGRQWKGKKLVLKTLSPKKFPQQQFDLVFNKNFEPSHNWKHGSVYFYGYRCANPIDEITTEDDSEDELEDELPVIAADSGKSKSQAKHGVDVVEDGLVMLQ